MKAWLCIPSARDEKDSTIGLWRDAGYGVALFRNVGASPVLAHLVSTGDYPGYATAVNRLVGEVLQRDPECSWVVAGGDDVCPDPNHSPAELTNQLTEHFAGTFGVCQFTGDRFAGGSIDRIAGSPWIGRDFAERMYGGNGPLYFEYTHMWVDEELQHVAIKYGVFWQRPDLIHLHRHFQRESDALDSPALPVDGVKIKRPHFLEEANTDAHWTKYKGIYLNRKQRGFPGSEPL